MPVVAKEQLKIWFSNFKKPPEGEFWAWLDSFRHILDKVPLDDVEGLTEKLQKKADLVDGVVPEEQLPFSVVTSEVIALGNKSVTGNKVNLAVHSSGANKVRVKGQLITRAFPNEWTITPIVADGNKVLRGFAVKNELDFFLAEGPELPTIEDPEIPEGSLEIFKITMNASGVIIEETDSGLKYVSSDAWRQYVVPSTDPFTLIMGNSLASSFEILTKVTTPTIGLISAKVGKPFWDGSPFLFYNNSNYSLEFVTQTYADTEFFTFLTFEPFTAKAGSYSTFKIKGGKLVNIPSGGGASFPEIGNDGDVLELDNSLPEKVKWVAKLKGSVNKMLHYWDAGNWVNSGVEFISAGIIKVRSIVLTTSTGTALPNELGTDGSNVWFGVAKKKLAYQGEIFEHQVRGKRVELAGVGGTSLNIDLNAGNLFALTNTGVGNVPIAFTNMILADESAVFNLIVTGNLLTLPAGLIADSYNDIPNVTKKRKYIFTIEKGGISPIISYNLINI